MILKNSSYLWAYLLTTVLLLGTPQNVIILISDGAGYGSWQAAEYFHYGELNKALFHQDGWSHYACSTHMADLYENKRATGQQNVHVIYDSKKAYDQRSEPALIGSGDFRGYNWLKRTMADSAGSGSAISTGIKTFSGAINWCNQTNRGLYGRSLIERAKAQGKLTGVVTSVPISHATPAALGGAHHPDRNNYTEIAQQMLLGTHLDLLFGCGHPLYDDNSHKLDTPVYFDFVGGQSTWSQLTTGSHPNNWQLITAKTEFESATKTRHQLPLLGIAQVASTLQQRRADYDPDDLPFEVPMNKNVPSLTTMTLGALNQLSRNNDGFFLAVEAGAVDWANHANQASRMIECQVGYYQMVQAVSQWVDENSNWQDTLVILTADHDNGLILGPNSDTKFFAPIVNHGKGKLPGLRYNTASHTNSLVPIFLKGANTEHLSPWIRGTDPRFGPYLDNTDIFRIIEQKTPKQLPFIISNPRIYIKTGQSINLQLLTNVAPVNFSAQQLPSWLTLDSSGQLSGKAPQSGTYYFDLKVDNTCGQTTRRFVIVVSQ